MSVAIMQPYFFPYLGYWQLINAVDRFILYDNIKFTKKSWIRRNRILLNGVDSLFTLPVKHDSDSLDIRERVLFDSFDVEREKILKKIKDAYKRAPQYHNVFPIIEECFRYESKNLFQYIHHSIVTVATYLEIETSIIISSNIEMDHSLKNKDRVIANCIALSEDTYINPVGGVELYDKTYFLENGINLHFIKMRSLDYKQFENEFISNLSIIDVLMFNSKEEVKKMLKQYDLI
ncbi:WbqC family protein [Psychrobacillus sp. FSL H8-0510]|uniref:WbqC family protein n=1 Tax=Psychrobacillus sp. FSL H8-0510 TaxID=2921394 RepID=UPI0030F5DCBE